MDEGGLLDRFAAQARTFWPRARHLSRRVTNHQLFLPALLGVCIRLVMIPYSSWPWDYNAFYRGALDMLAMRDPYVSGTYPYPPLFAYSYFPLVLLASSLVGQENLAYTLPELASLGSLTGMMTPTITAPAFNTAVKMPILLGDLGVGVLLFRLLNRMSGPNAGRTAFLLWFLNPFVIFTSAVLGQLDSIPTFFVLLALTLVIDSRPFWAGMSVALGALFKLYPAFLGIAFLGLVLASPSRSRSPEPRGEAGRALLAYATGILTVVVIFWLPLHFTSGYEAVYHWTQRFGVGGLTLFSLSHLKSFAWLRLAVRDLQPGLQMTLLAAAFVVSLLTALAVWIRLRRRGENSLPLGVAAGVVTVSALYLVLTNVNAQYLIWVCPFLIMAGQRVPLAKKLLFGMGGVGLAQYLALQGPLSFLYPLAVFSGVLEVSAVNASIIAYWSTETPLGPLVSLMWAGIGLGGFALISATAVLGLMLLRSPYSSLQDNASVPDKEQRGRPPEISRRTPLVAMVLLVTAALLSVQVAIFAIPSSGESITLSIQDVSTVASPDGSLRIRVRYSVTGGSASLLMRVVATPLLTEDIHSPVYFYVDENHPLLYLNQLGVQRLGASIAVQLAKRNYPFDIQAITSTEFRTILESSCVCVVIMATSVLPVSVFSRDINLVTPFLQRGGILIWVGDLIGGYVARPGQEKVNWDDPLNPQWEGEKAIFGGPVVRWPAGVTAEADIPTSTAQALDLQFRHVRTAADLGDLLARGGRPIGYLQTAEPAKSSISVVPVGRGYVILFGFHAWSPRVASPSVLVATDIAQILLSGTVFGVTHPAFADVEFKPGDTLSDELVILVDKQTSPPLAVLVYAYSTGGSSEFFWSASRSLGSEALSS